MLSEIIISKFQTASTAQELRDLRQSVAMMAYVEGLSLSLTALTSTNSEMLLFSNHLSH